MSEQKQKKAKKFEKETRPQVIAAEQAVLEEASTMSKKETGNQAKSTTLYAIVQGESCGKYYDVRPKELYRSLAHAEEVFWREQLSPNSCQGYQTFLVDFWEELTEQEKFETTKSLLPHYHAQYESVSKITLDSISKLSSKSETMRQAEQTALETLRADLIDVLENKLFDYLHAITSVEMQYRVLMLFQATKKYRSLVNDNVDTFNLIE